MRKWLTTVAVAAACSTMMVAQGTAGQSTAKPGAERGGMQDAKSADADFMQTAAMDSLAEIEHGRLAAKNAQNDDVKAFGQRMVDDHSKANNELKGIASKKGVTLPTSLNEKHQAMHQKLQKMNGAEFDRAYMQHMVQAHKNAVSLFERESKSGKDAETRAWAEKTLPTLQEHLKQATAITAKVGKAGA